MANCRLCALVIATAVFLPIRVGNAAPADHSTALASVLDEQAIAVVYLDFGRIDVDAVLGKFGDVSQNNLFSRHIRRARESLQPVVPVLRNAGAEVYCVFSLLDLPAPGPFFVVKSKPGTDRKMLVELLSTLKHGTCEIVGDLVFCGPQPTLQRIRSGAQVKRPQLDRGLEVAGEAPAQLIIFPSADHRRVLAEMLPTLPDEFGGGSGRAFADVEWAAVAISQTPNTSVQITIQSVNAESAMALKDTLKSLFAALSRMQAIRTAVPKVDDLSTVAVPRVEGNRLSLRISEADGNLKLFLNAMAEPVARAQVQASRAQCTNNLKQLALAMHNYHDVHTRFPAAYTRDGKDKPLLSWRVHLLPFLDELKLYEQFHLDEPWDSEHNRKLISQLPQSFRCSQADLTKEGKTTFVVPVGDKSLFGGKEGIRIRDIRDGTSNTIMILEVNAANAVIWTKPDDLNTDPQNNPLAKTADQHGNQFAVAMCDGSANWLKRDMPPAVLQLLIDPNDGQVIPEF